MSNILCVPQAALLSNRTLTVLYMLTLKLSWFILWRELYLHCCTGSMRPIRLYPNTHASWVHIDVCVMNKMRRPCMCTLEMKLITKTTLIYFSLANTNTFCILVSSFQEYSFVARIISFIMVLFRHSKLLVDVDLKLFILLEILSFSISDFKIDNFPWLFHQKCFLQG